MGTKSPAGLFRGLFEAHLHVADLEKAMRFYGDVLGLELALHETKLRAAFYWIGGKRSTMLGVWEKPPWHLSHSGNLAQPQHLAFEVAFEDLQTAIDRVKQHGIQPRNFFNQETDEPSVFGWMPAASIYFNDIDGHLLEFIAKIDDEPAPDLGIVSLSEWHKLVKSNQSNGMIREAPNPAAITIRPAVSEDSDGIARTFLESAEYHAHLDPERYSVPTVETITARYREGRQHPPDAGGADVTLIAELSGGIVGFIDARLEQSLDAMHRKIIYCHVAEIAVSRKHQNQGIGGQLLRAAEDWGRRQGAEFASLEYHAANTRASVFYQRRMGYCIASITAIKRL